MTEVLFDTGFEAVDSDAGKFLQWIQEAGKKVSKEVSYAQAKGLVRLLLNDTPWNLGLVGSPETGLGVTLYELESVLSGVTKEKLFFGGQKIDAFLYEKRVYLF